ncbi:MAG: MoxR family ATPase [Deltaproteobacteria bacterium]|nr:MoxR family ATPase [Deltaproteobacteria bacterium]
MECVPVSIKSVKDVSKALKKQKYIASKEIATIVYLGIRMQRPVLVEGPAGVGKTELARAMAKAMHRELIHLQCYEGIDETKAIYEWEYAKQLLYTQLLKEKIHELVDSARDLSQAIQSLDELENAFFSDHFLLQRPLLRAITSEEQSVLLIDEVDKPDPEFEAYLLEVLNNYEITIPELGTRKPRVIPMVFLTSNANRDLSDALKRRCLHLFIDYPSQELECKIVASRFPDMDKSLINKLVRSIHRIRDLDIKKKPAISETIDWAESLLTLNIRNLEADELRKTLGIISKYKTDMDTILQNSARILGDDR